VKKVLIGVGAAALLASAAWGVSAVVIAGRHQDEFRAFDAWEAGSARTATELAVAEPEAFQCSRRPRSRDPAKQLLGVVDFSASLRAAEGVELPFSDHPSVVYVGPGGLHSRPEAVASFRRYRSDASEVAKDLLRWPAVWQELASPRPQLRVPALQADVSITLLARSVDEAEGLLTLVVDVAVESTDHLELLCRGRVELSLGEVGGDDDARTKALARALQQLVESP
jgi:hypothetical protein